MVVQGYPYAYSMQRPLERFWLEGLGLRSLWLDTLRAAAITAVVIYHLVQMSPQAGSLVAGVTKYGRFGVDLFFVLSGWLIGTLYWREYKTTGDVALLRFWLRRALRTVPPYYCALVVHWLGVRAARSEPFDLGYLFFVQNYQERMPFFFVSWSLCIEEHFYALAPLLALAASKCVGIRRVPLVLLSIVLLPALLRLLEYSSLNHDGFGYAATATHLHMDGLVIGFTLSFFGIFHRSILRPLHGLLPIAAIAAAVITFWTLCSGARMGYVASPLSLAVCFGFLLVWGEVGGYFTVAKVPASLSRLVMPIALVAYSAYLTHPLAIHAARFAAPRLGGLGDLGFWVVALATVAGTTALFWLMVERPAIRLRDRLVARGNVSRVGPQQAPRP